MNTTHISSDLDVVRDDYDDGLPLAIKVNGYEEWISPSEAQALIDAVTEALKDHGYEVKRPIEQQKVPETDLRLTAIEKRLDALEAAGKSPEDRLLGDLFPADTPVEPQEEPTDEDVLAAAVIDGLEVTFDYKGIFDVNPRRRYFEPSEINTSERYVFGLDVQEDAPRRFSLDRISGPVEFA